MDSSIRRTLWSAFAALTTLIVLGVVLTVAVLQVGNKEDLRLVEETVPLIDAVGAMRNDTTLLMSAARAFSLTNETQFTSNYDDAVADEQKNHDQAKDLATEPQDLDIIKKVHDHFLAVKSLTDQQIEKSRQHEDVGAMVRQISQMHRLSPDWAAQLATDYQRRERAEWQKMNSRRAWMTILMIIVGLTVIALAGFTVIRIQDSLTASINRQVRRTEAMIAGMSEGVMLVDHHGNTVFINPAGQTLLGRTDINVPIERQADVYGLRGPNGEKPDPKELPAAQALSTSKAVRDVTMFIVRDDRRIAISVTAAPLHEDGRVSGVIVTFRDITERRRLEEELQLQAERAQILADAGAFFASNIDPDWVTQAIAERTAEVLGDWTAVILKTGGNELRVASIYHRDLASLGLAWSYVYRQPLVVGEGIIGQVVSTGYPSMMQNVGGTTTSPGFAVGTSQRANPTKLASLLILPLRTRREMLGALVIAANDPERALTDEKLPLAEVLAERAALAIENAKLYTEQVEARRKVEDLSRLKDEFLSIASHELRTPVTSIKGYTQLAKTLIRENDLTTSEEYLDIALDQIDRMSRLIIELLDVSRIETGRLEIRRESIAWSRFVRDVVARHHSAVTDRRVQLAVIEGDGKMITGDRDRLEQVLGNLLENAVKYSPDGSEILVSVEDKGDQLVTSVADRGIGIPTDEIAQVFERFHRGRQVSSTNYGGLGLGLYITKQIVERHGGSIWVESREGQGTTFSFALPVTATPQSAHEAQPEPRPQAVSHA